MHANMEDAIRHLEHIQKNYVYKVGEWETLKKGYMVAVLKTKFGNKFAGLGIKFEKLKWNLNIWYMAFKAICQDHNHWFSTFAYYSYSMRFSTQYTVQFFVQINKSTVSRMSQIFAV